MSILTRNSIVIAATHPFVTAAVRATFPHDPDSVKCGNATVRLGCLIHDMPPGALPADIVSRLVELRATTLRDANWQAPICASFVVIPSCDGELLYLVSNPVVDDWREAAGRLRAVSEKSGIVHFGACRIDKQGELVVEVRNHPVRYRRLDEGLMLGFLDPARYQNDVTGFGQGFNVFSTRIPELIEEPDSLRSTAVKFFSEFLLKHKN